MSVFQELLGGELPIVQAPMAGVQGSALAVAVSNAGGIGSLPCAMLAADGLRKELAAITAQTRRPYNVNFFCHTPPTADVEREARWRALLAPYYRELDIDPSTIPTGPGRNPFSSEMADVLDAFRPPIVTFTFGLPSEDLMARVRKLGAKIIGTATTVVEARWLEARGVDAIVAQGYEAGGHRGIFLSDDLTTQIGTLALLPQIVRAVRIPVLAAGGIGDARGVAAATALGAAGAQIGTAYLLCPEATTSAVHRAVARGEAGEHTAVTNLFTGRPARGVVNRFMREVGPVNPAAPAFPLATAALAPLRAKAEARDSGDFSPLWCGQNARACKDIGAAQLTRELAGAR